MRVLGKRRVIIGWAAVARGWRTPAFFGVLMAALAASGCSRGPKGPQLGGIYRKAASQMEDHRHPVIVIPGIMGSKLVDNESGQSVWGVFDGTYASPRRDDGARLFALPMEYGKSLNQLRDGLRTDGVLDRVKVKLAAVPLEVRAYAGILATLGVGGYRDQELGEAGAVQYGNDHFTCFQFPYDWRRDNAENARKLHAFILQKEEFVKAELTKRYGKAPNRVTFDIVAHSMGGLIARYYLRYGDVDLPPDGGLPKLTWAGAAHVRRAVLIGTPNAGSVKAMEQLVNGAKPIPVKPKYPAAMLGTLPSIYQLLPRSRHERVVYSGETPTPVGDIYDPALWERNGWGLADEEQDEVLEVLLPNAHDQAARRRIALSHLRKCLGRAKQFAAALDRPAQPPAGLELTLFAGDAVATPSILGVERETGEVVVRTYAAGDGTVTRASAIMDEREGGEWQRFVRTPIGWHHVYFLSSNHLALTSDHGFSDNVLYRLLEAPEN